MAAYDSKLNSIIGDIKYPGWSDLHNYISVSGIFG